MRLSLSRVSYSYPDGTEALKEITLEVSSGEVAVILGPNGSGKSTLLLIMAGLLTPTSGEVTLDGRGLGRWYRRICGIMFQDPRDQLVAPTVWEDVSLAPKQLGLEVDSRVKDALRFFGVEELADRSPFRLSRGQAAKVILAGLRAHDPFVLLLDEPCSSLDAEGTERLIEFIREFRERDRIVVVASQSSYLASKISDKVFVLNGGRLVVSGPADIVLSDGDALARAGVRPPCF